MEALTENISSLVLGVVIPLSTMAIVAIECGDTRQPVHKQKKPLNAPKSKRSKQGRVSSKQRSRKDKSGKASSSHRSREKDSEKDKLESKKDQAKNSVKKGAKEVSQKLKQAKDSSKHAIASKLPNTSSKEEDGSVSRSSKGNESYVKKSASSTGANSVGSASKPMKGQSLFQKPAKTQEPLLRRSIPIFTSEPMDVRVEPHELHFSTTGGLQQITLSNSINGVRHAVKAKCSDNGLYRVNPVYAFVEPGKSVPLNIYRNSSATSESQVDKLVLIVAKVPNEETDPMHAFTDNNVIHSMLVLPLHVVSAPSVAHAFSETTGLCV